MDKKSKVIICAIVATVIAIVLLLLFNKKPTGDSGDATPESSIAEIIFENETEGNSETEESSSADIIEEEESKVDLGVDFKFDNNRSDTIIVNGNTVTESDIKEGSIFDDPIMQMTVRHDTDNTDGWFYQASEHSHYSSASGNIIFYGNHSDSAITVIELSPDLTTDEVKQLTYGNLMFQEYLSTNHDIPFNTEYKLGKGFKNPEDFFTDIDYDGEYGDEAISDYYQILFDTSIETSDGIFYCIGWYGGGDKPYNINGYYTSNDGRKFRFYGNDSMYDYLIAYVADIFENCVIPITK